MNEVKLLAMRVQLIKWRGHAAVAKPAALLPSLHQAVLRIPLPNQIIPCPAETANRMQMTDPRLRYVIERRAEMTQSWPVMMQQLACV